MEFLLGIFGNLIATIISVLCAFVIQNLYRNWRYKGWKVILFKKFEQILERNISPRKAKEILEEPSDLAVFVKGVISPYERLNCDILKDDKCVDLMKIDRKRRIITIDLDKNPTKKNNQNKASIL